MKKSSIFLKAILGGIIIGIGGTVYLSVPNAIVGALFFTIGLFTIVSYGLTLYTGSVGYLVAAENKKDHALNLLLIWLGNFIGCALCASGVYYAKPQLTKRALEIYTIKLSQPTLAALILSVLCGLLMFIAVDNYKNNSSDLGKYIGLFLCVPIFILSGFEHSIANMFTFSMANGVLGLTYDGLAFILLCTLGNALGGMVFPFCNLIMKK